MRKVKSIPIMVLLTQLLMACSSSDSMNKIVQNGGTIMISLGSYEELGHVTLSKADLTAKMIDSVGSEAWVTVREVVPLETNKSSSLSNLVTDDADGYSGFWIAVIDLIDTSNGLDTTFDEGGATLEVHGLSEVKVSMLNILPGEGAVNPIMRFGDINTLNMLRPAAQVKIVVTDPTIAFTESNLLGAIEFKYVYPTANVSGLPPSKWPRAVSASNDTHLQITSFTKSDAGTNTLHVIAVNPAGIGKLSAPSLATSEFYQASTVSDVRFGVVYPPSVGAAPFTGANLITGYSTDGSELSTDALLVAIPSM